MVLMVSESGDEVTLYLEHSLQSISALRFELQQDHINLCEILHVSNKCANR